MGLRLEVSPFGPRMYFIFRKSGEAAGPIATLFGDISVCGEPVTLQEARSFSEVRCGKLKV